MRHYLYDVILLYTDRKSGEQGDEHFLVAAPSFFDAERWGKGLPESIVAGLGERAPFSYSYLSCQCRDHVTDAQGERFEVVLIPDREERPAVITESSLGVEVGGRWAKDVAEAVAHAQRMWPGRPILIKKEKDEG